MHLQHSLQQAKVDPIYACLIHPQKINGTCFSLGTIFLMAVQGL